MFIINGTSLHFFRKYICLGITQVFRCQYFLLLKMKRLKDFTWKAENENKQQT